MTDTDLTTPAPAPTTPGPAPTTTTDSPMTDRKIRVRRTPPVSSAPSTPAVEPVDAVDAVDPQVRAPYAAFDVPAGEGGAWYFVPAGTAPAEPERLILGWFRPTIIPATLRLVAVVGCSCVVPVYNGGSLAALFAGVVVRYLGAGATGPNATGGHITAGFICTAVVWWSWRLDPGPKPEGAGRHEAAKLWWHTKHFVCRVLRWAAILGSAAVPALAAGILHITTGVTSR